MEQQFINRRPVINRCIYCDYNGNDLSDEHAIPKSIMPKREQDVVLKRASCPSCQKITSQLERATAIHFKDAKNIFSLKQYNRGGKNKRKSDRTGFLEVQSKDGEKRTLPARQALPTIPIPYLTEPPRILSGEIKQKKHDINRLWISLGSPDQNNKPNFSFKKKTEYYHSNAYFRMCAKIAYCVCICEYGIDTFDSLVTDFILSGDGDSSFFLGNSDILRAILGVRTDSHDLHTFDNQSVSCDFGEFYCCEVSLFNVTKAPPTLVVVGGKRYPSDFHKNRLRRGEIPFSLVYRKK